MEKTIYILNRVKFLANGGVKEQTPTIHEDLKSAQAKFHRNIGNDMDDTTLSGSVSVITDSKGGEYDNFSWGEIIESTVK